LLASVSTQSRPGWVCTRRVILPALNGAAREPWWRASPPIDRRELGLVALAGVLLAVAMHWPLALHLERDIPKDLGDPLFEAWQLAWGGHALLHQPLDYFQANTFYPEKNTLAFGDALVGYSPVAALGDGPGGAVAVHNVLFHFAYALAFAGAYLLARELGVGRAGAAVAGVAFAYAPWRLEHNSRLNILSSGGIPLALFLGLRGYRRERPRMVVAAWLVAAWQLTLGSNLGLQLVYLLAVLALVAAVPLLRHRRPPSRSLAVATAAGVLAFALVGWLHARPYLEVRRDHQVVRSPEEVDFYSTSPRAFLAASADSLVWGERTAGVREELDWPTEQTLFPGLAILGLTLAGAVARTYPRRLRAGLGAATVAVAVLSLGFSVDGSRLLQPYRLLYDHAPGWDGVRVPERLMTLTTLGLALLAGAGAAAVARRAGRRAALVAVALVAAVLVESAGFRFGEPGRGFVSGLRHPTVPRAPAAQRGLPAPQLHLPAETGEDSSPLFVLWSSDGFPKIVNGLGSIQPASYTRVQERTTGFPDRPSIELLRSMGVRTVVLHPELAVGTAWEGVATRPVRGLPLRREDRGGLVIYRLLRDPPP
jgi:hypothetical protein